MNNKRRIYLKKKLNELLEAQRSFIQGQEFCWDPEAGVEKAKKLAKLKEEFIKDMLDS